MNLAINPVLPTLITNKTKDFRFKSERVVWVADKAILVGQVGHSRSFNVSNESFLLQLPSGTSLADLGG